MVVFGVLKMGMGFELWKVVKDRLLTIVIILQ